MTDLHGCQWVWRNSSHSKLVISLNYERRSAYPIEIIFRNKYGAITLAFLRLKVQTTADEDVFVFIPRCFSFFITLVGSESDPKSLDESSSASFHFLDFRFFYLWPQNGWKRMTILKFYCFRSRGLEKGLNWALWNLMHASQ